MSMWSTIYFYNTFERRHPPDVSSAAHVFRCWTRIVQFDWKYVIIPERFQYLKLILLMSLIIQVISRCVVIPHTCQAFNIPLWFYYFSEKFLYSFGNVMEKNYIYVLSLYLVKLASSNMLLFYYFKILTG